MLQSDQLFHVQNLFAQGNYAACILSATPLLSSPAESAEDVALLAYTLRSHLALPSPSSSYADLLASASSSEDPTLRAIAVLAALTALVPGADAEAVLEQARDLAIELEEADQGQGASAKAVVGTVFVRAGEWVEAVDVLSSEKESLECAAILVQIYLSINRLDMARKVYDAVKAYGDDAHLVQQIEAWLGLRSQGPALQQAYYFYDELLLAPSSSRAPAILAAHGAAHQLLGHADEAQADVEQALGTNEGKAEPAVLALGAVTYGGEKGESFYSQLAAAAPSHPAVADYAAKASLFDAAAAKFAVAAA